jgi:hypothetical protein
MSNASKPINTELLTLEETAQVLGYSGGGEYRSSDDGVDKLQSETVDQLIDVIKGDDKAIRDAALVLLFGNIFAHRSDMDYIGAIASQARDRAFYGSLLAQMGVREYVSENSGVLDILLCEWQGITPPDSDEEEDPKVPQE